MNNILESMIKLRTKYREQAIEEQQRIIKRGYFISKYGDKIQVVQKHTGTAFIQRLAKVAMLKDYPELSTLVHCIWATGADGAEL